LHSVSPVARFRSPLAAPVLQGFLSVRDVAAQLGMSAATVYKLCAARELPYMRILGAIRIAPADLAAFYSSKLKRGY
jgi:excisionase family DNA binding protein